MQLSGMSLGEANAVMARDKDLLDQAIRRWNEWIKAHESNDSLRVWTANECKRQVESLKHAGRSVDPNEVSRITATLRTLTGVHSVPPFVDNDQVTRFWLNVIENLYPQAKEEQ